MEDDYEHPEDQALIHLRVSKTLKHDWVRRSRLEGKKLTTWIVERVERSDCEEIDSSKKTGDD